MDTGSIVRAIERGSKRRAAARLVTASRACFDAGLRGASVAAARLDAVREAQAEAARLRAELAALRGSTAWRITAPLRHALAWLRGPETPPEPAPPPPLYVPMDYAAWIKTQEAELKRRLGQALPGNQKLWAPRLALIVLPGEGAPLESGGCEIFQLEHADAFDFALQMDADFIGFHDPRDRLAPDALALMREALARAPDTVLAFADEDWLDAAGQRSAPFFKPGWDAELARGRDLPGPFAFFRAALLRAALPPSGAAWRVDLAARIAAMAGPEQILHIPAVLCHRAAPAPPIADALPARLECEGMAARLEHLPVPGLHRVVYDLPPVAPLVSILICTRDRADLLRACMEGILHGTDYSRFEVILVDHGSTAPDALELLEDLAADPRVTILRDAGEFNWARLNNAAAARAKGEILLLLNNDIAVLGPGWLHELAAQAVQPGVGAVGAKLLYPDGRIQHAGLSVDGAGIPSHLYRFAPASAPGMSDMLLLAREVWAVTGACMAVPRAVFQQLGGLNEALAVACNDVEFCLRLGALGYRIIFTPWAVLEHHEQATRLADTTEAKRQRALDELGRLLRDWGPLALHDPYLNPNLMLFEEQPVPRELAAKQGAIR